MNEDEIKDMVEYCKYSDGCFDCPYNPEDNRSMYALRWYGGCPDCDKELVRAMGKGYRKVADDEIVIKKSEQKQWLKDCIESNKKTEEIARKQTAREILQRLWEERNVLGQLMILETDLTKLAKEYDIELE